ncbi:MAG: Ni/Fe-hydrogenase, b-type cytochrome subunit [Desulfobulbaceae bacterium]|nr:Ni/Fe-hydrogenase, b-type cytochrome subunit [Desulfobulbaceae bacterium]
MRYYEIHYTWSVLLRLFHWAFALSIVTLVVTGFYIHFPWTNTNLEAATTFPVATMRYIHFIAGFVFTGALLARFYLMFFGNRQERIWDSIPVNRKNTSNLSHTIKFYLYFSDDHTPRKGHNALAGIFYFITFILALLQMFSGFYMLYPESAFIQKWAYFIFGPQQQGRFMHYLFMWYFIIFSFVHVYIVIWNDIITKEGLISSIFTGTKFIPPRKP